MALPNFRSASRVPSVEPSSTTITSFSGHVWSSALCTEAAIHRSALKHGMPMETRDRIKAG